jgi:hypothetical protein
MFSFSLIQQHYFQTTVNDQDSLFHSMCIRTPTGHLRDEIDPHTISASKHVLHHSCRFLLLSTAMYAATSSTAATQQALFFNLYCTAANNPPFVIGCPSRALTTVTLPASLLPNVGTYVLLLQLEPVLS